MIYRTKNNFIANNIILHKSREPLVRIFLGGGKEYSFTKFKFLGQAQKYAPIFISA